MQKYLKQHKMLINIYKNLQNKLKNLILEKHFLIKNKQIIIKLHYFKENFYHIVIYGLQQINGLTIKNHG